MSPNIHQRLSSWRNVDHPVERVSERLGVSRSAEEHARQQMRRIGILCLLAVKEHDSRYADLEAYVVGQGHRSHQHQQRVNDHAAFALRVYEQGSALALETAVRNVLQDLPREVVRTERVYVQSPRRSWWQLLVGG